MKKVEIYSADTCPYCQQAKGILKREGIPFKEYKIIMAGGRKVEDDNFKEMKQRANGQTTVPQIVIDGSYYGDDDTLTADLRKGSFAKKFKG
tara:strand:+ start:196 stop:471 length:276 start_codon:yes stop_codon:yes gene_type:complete